MNFKIDCNGSPFNHGIRDAAQARAVFSMYASARPSASYTFTLRDPNGVVLDTVTSPKVGGAKKSA